MEWSQILGQISGDKYQKCYLLKFWILAFTQHDR